MRILLVEDEPNIARPVGRALESQGHTVSHAATRAQARARLLANDPYDLLILDVMLPGDPEGGFHLAQEAIGAGYPGHILYLTALDGLEDRLRGLDSGDDYLTKPFDLPELLARVRALLRRHTPVQASRYAEGDLSVDFAARGALERPVGDPHAARVQPAGTLRAPAATGLLGGRAARSGPTRRAN